MENVDVRQKLNSIPKKPGCYLWKDKNGIVIYVGKAKNLFNRTRQYFLKQNDLKTKKLVNEIRDIDYVLVKNENESLLLENNLIAKYKPKFNMLLREANTFPYIVVTKEEHPRIIYTHDNQKKIKGTYYGPFASASVKKYELYNFINRIFPLRKCKVLPKTKCIYYDIGQCLGPCIKNIDKDQYEEYLKKIRDFFSGNSSEIDKYLELQEKRSSEKLMFEDSQKYLELRKNLKYFSERQDIIFSRNNDEDIIGYHCKENVIALVIFKYVNGSLLSKYDTVTIFYSSEEDIISTLLFDYYHKVNVEKPKIVNVSLSDEILKMLQDSLKIKFHNPLSGKKKVVMKTALDNAVELMKNKYLTLISNHSRESNSLNELQDILSLDQLYRIELFDNSNVYGSDKVAAMVVYENGQKNKNAYRKFIIKNNEAKSDFEYMKEVIHRRYKKVLESGESLPNLIIVDGGKPQVHAALDSLKELNLDKVVPLIGLAKDDKHKTDRIVKSDMSEIILDKKSNLYFFLLNMQDEVHRFAIAFHRNKRTKSLFENSLYKIKGLGKKNIDKLIEKYQTVEKIKAASVEELSQIIPKKIATLIKELK